MEAVIVEESPSECRLLRPVSDLWPPTLERRTMPTANGKVGCDCCDHPLQHAIRKAVSSWPYVGARVAFEELNDAAMQWTEDETDRRIEQTSLRLRGFPLRVVYDYDDTVVPDAFVAEWVKLPSGNIVVLTTTGESYWFDKHGKHPKSHLSSLPPGESGKIHGAPTP